MNIIYAPGPWRVKGASIQAIDHGIQYNIARVGNAKLSPRGAAGTARVMAAAPEMLETLKYVLDRIPEHDTETISQIKAAIAKADGEPA